MLKMFDRGYENMSDEELQKRQDADSARRRFSRYTNPLLRNTGSIGLLERTFTWCEPILFKRARVRSFSS